MPNWYRTIDEELHKCEDDGLHAVITARYGQHPDYEALHEAVQAALDDFLAKLPPEQRRAYMRLEQALAARRLAEDESTFSVAFEMGIVRGLERSPVGDALAPETRAAAQDLTASLASHHLGGHERHQALALLLMAELLGTQP